MDEIEKMLLEVKDTSELMIDLAYSSLLYNNHEIAEEVLFMEEMVDEMVHNIQEKAIGRVLEDGDASKAMVVISLANSLEAISDAAMQIADVVLRDVTPHPVFQMSVRDSDSIISTALVSGESDLAHKSIGAVKLASYCGMRAIAIKRGNRFIFGPDKYTVMEPEDILIVRGPEDGEEFFRDLASGKEKVEDLG
ncbi:MAG TPA: PhoU domain-containing protein [Methanomassiliicoccales archaeon]|nr:PhoU domain-containing protein [Methanomassiliicoccales archaeon]